MAHRLMKSVFFNIIVILNIHYIYQANISRCPLQETNEIGYVEIVDFEKFSDINFTNCRNQFNISTLILKPNQNLILDYSLNFTGLKVNVSNESNFLVLFLITLKELMFVLIFQNTYYSVKILYLKIFIGDLKQLNFNFM